MSHWRRYSKRAKRQQARFGSDLLESRPFFHYAPQKAWKMAHPDRYQIKPLAPPKPTKTLLLWAVNEFFSAGAIYQRIHGIWSCTKADKPLKWLIGLNVAKAKLELLRRAYQWQWRQGAPFSHLSNESTDLAMVDFVAQTKSEFPLVGNKGRSQTNIRNTNPDAAFEPRENDTGIAAGSASLLTTVEA